MMARAAANLRTDHAALLVIRPLNAPGSKPIAVRVAEPNRSAALKPGAAMAEISMPDETLSPAVKQLLSRHIGSVEQLEVLLLLRGSPERAWTSAEVYDVIRSSPVSVGQRLEASTAAGFLTKEEGPPVRFVAHR